MTLKPLTSFSAVIFDLDGVLIDSMPSHVQAWQEVFQKLGIHLPADEIRMHEGEKAKITIRRFVRKHNLTLSDGELDELIARKRQIYRTMAPQGLRPNARVFVESVRHKGIKTAIVTGSVRTNLDWTLNASEQALFDVIVTSELCEQGKPHPEPYLKAARELEVLPDRCLVIENAPLGIRSAKAAQMTCLAITTTLPAEMLQEADFILPDLEHWN